MKITISSDMFGLSSTKPICRNAVLHLSNDVAMMWWLCHLISQWGVWLNTSDLTQWSGLSKRIASDLVRLPKISCTVWSIIGLGQSLTCSQTEIMPIWGLRKKSPYGNVFHMGIAISIWCSPYRILRNSHLGVSCSQTPIRGLTYTQESSCIGFFTIT